MLEYNEKTYKRIGRAGAFNITMGVLMIVGGIAGGVLAIVHGAKLLGSRASLID